VKTYDPTVLTALAQSNVILVLFIELELDDVTVRYCTSGYDLEWDSHTWSGMGAVMSVEPFTETNRVEAIGWKLVLSGVPSDLISLALQENVVGRRATAWVGVYTTAGVMVDAPVKEYEGRMSHMDLDDQPTNSQIIVAVESRLVSLLGAEDSLWTDAEQQRKYPGDEGLKFISITAERTLSFGPKR